MILEKVLFEARLAELPMMKVKEEKKPGTDGKDPKEKLEPLGTFTVGKKYKVLAIYDSGQGFTDFLVTDDKGVFHWINMTVFRSK